MSNPEDSQGSHTSDIKEVNYSLVRKIMHMAGRFMLATSSINTNNKPRTPTETACRQNEGECHQACTLATFLA
jgi:hypothetical protein